MVIKAKQKVPVLRFPEFEVEWEALKLGEIATFQRGFDLPTSKREEGPYPVVSSSGISGYHNEYKVKPPGIVTGRYGSIGALFYLEEEFWPLNTSLWVKDFHKNHPKYIFFYLNRIDFKKFSDKTGVPGVNRNDLHKIKAAKPKVPEQQKITQFLTTIDTRIQQLSRKVELLEQYKKGVTQRIFSQELRFRDEGGKGFPDWEEKKLGSIGKTYSGLSGKSKTDFGEGKPYITYKQVFDSSKIDISRFELVQISSGENQNLAIYGDIIFTTSSETPHEVGFSSVLLDTIDELYLNSFCFGFRPNSLKMLNPEFAQFLFRSENFRKKLYKLAQGSTRYNLSKNNMLKLTITIPSESEQKKIAAFLITIDQKITQTQKKLNQVQTFKKGLLQQLFV